MGDLGEQLNALNEEQKQAIRTYAVTAVETAKLDFRAGVAGSYMTLTAASRIGQNAVVKIMKTVEGYDIIMRTDQLFD